MDGRIPLNLTLRDISLFYMDQTPSLHLLNLPLEVIEHIMSYVAADMLEYIKNKREKQKIFNVTLNSYLTKFSDGKLVEKFKRVAREHNICNPSMIKNIKMIEYNPHLQRMLHAITFYTPRYLDTDTHSIEVVRLEILKSINLTKKYYRDTLLKEVNCRICRDIIDKYFLIIVEALVLSDCEMPKKASTNACLGISLMCKAIRERSN